MKCQRCHKPHNGIEGLMSVGIGKFKDVTVYRGLNGEKFTEQVEERRMICRDCVQAKVNHNAQT